MTFGFPARASSELAFKAEPGLLRRCVLRALTALGWQITLEEEREIQAAVSLNLWSWGEQLRVEISDDGAVRATSRCAFPLQCLDWGKNRRNVARFLEQVQMQLATRDAWERAEEA